MSRKAIHFLTSLEVINGLAETSSLTLDPVLHQTQKFSETTKKVATPFSMLMQN
ncbi:hypothetical protein QE357_003837 [Siphonobacter sp. BAB-5404]|nr:hypothetical protein [Siphonobacter sp. SORGH_AS_1065]MDR6196785.1 hypothetical protein [Siphonobacter sp. SORGH_AS_0500]